jgi:hypothetical protein
MQGPLLHDEGAAFWHFPPTAPTRYGSRTRTTNTLGQDQQTLGIPGFSATPGKKRAVGFSFRSDFGDNTASRYKRAAPWTI